MTLVADARKFSSDSSFIGFMILVISVIALFVVPRYVMATLPPDLMRIKPAIVAASGGAIIVLLTIGLYLKGLGIIFKFPVRFFREGLIIQPATSLSPRFIPYEDITSIELWQGISYKRFNGGVRVSTRSGVNASSVERFASAEKAMEFLEAVRPALESSGLQLREKEEGFGPIRYLFRRELRIPFPAPLAPPS